MLQLLYILKCQYRAGNGATVAKVRQKVEPAPKLNNSGSATLLKQIPTVHKSALLHIWIRNFFNLNFPYVSKCESAHPILTYENIVTRFCPQFCSLLTRTLSRDFVPNFGHYLREHCHEILSSILFITYENIVTRFCPQFCSLLTRTLSRDFVPNFVH